LTIQHGLKPSDVIDNEGLMRTFKVSNSGGMRRSHHANALIIVSDHTKSTYDDRWIGDIFHYTGMGLIGPQSLDFSQNKTLSNSNRNNITVHLFEVFQRGRYIYMGEVYLAGEPYEEIQPDSIGNPRKVYMFPLKLKDGQQQVVLSPEALISKIIIQERKAKKLDDEELETKARYAPKKPGSRKVSASGYDRNAYVTEYAKRRANGICQLCDKPAPFVDKKGKPYLETHHIIWLSKGGEDTIENTIAICPNCHRKMHALNLPEDVSKLQQRALKRI
jgi:5-methylcytosine-specific restriction enzyme A